jgi:hypothetical protein
MFLVGLISWWYGRGWVGQWARILKGFRSTLDFFSVGQLLSTLFDPFRQISASGGGDGSFGASMRAFGDKLISRIVGAFVRLFTIIAGLVAITLQALYVLIIMLAWWLLPLFPVAGLILFAIGWVPSWI